MMAIRIILFRAPRTQRYIANMPSLRRRQPGVHFVGRLATYRYYNMDQVVAQALTFCSSLSGVSRALVAAASQGAATSTSAA